MQIGKTLKGQELRRPTPAKILAAILYHLVKSTGEREFTADSKNIHKFVRNLSEKCSELKEYFSFTKWYPFDYSYDLDEALSTLRRARIITIPDNPTYSKYELDDKSERYIEQYILPELPKDLHEKIREAIHSLEETSKALIFES